MEGVGLVERHVGLVSWKVFGWLKGTLDWLVGMCLVVWKPGHRLVSWKVFGRLKARFDWLVGKCLVC